MYELIRVSISSKEVVALLQYGRSRAKICSLHFGVLVPLQRHEQPSIYQSYAVSGHTSTVVLALARIHTRCCQDPPFYFLKSSSTPLVRRNVGCFTHSTC